MYEAVIKKDGCWQGQESQRAIVFSTLFVHTQGAGWSVILREYLLRQMNYVQNLSLFLLPKFAPHPQISVVHHGIWGTYFLSMSKRIGGSPAAFQVSSLHSKGRSSWKVRITWYFHQIEKSSRPPLPSPHVHKMQNIVGAGEKFSLTDLLVSTFFL